MGSGSLGRGHQELARYGQAHKTRIVARLLPPESSSVEDVSCQVGVSTATLERWSAGVRMRLPTDLAVAATLDGG
jgi:transposase-like protein